MKMLNTVKSISSTMKIIKNDNVFKKLHFQYQFEYFETSLKF